MQAHQHAKDYRPWGWFESLVNTPSYQVKRLHVYPRRIIVAKSSASIGTLGGGIWHRKCGAR